MVSSGRYHYSIFIVIITIIITITVIIIAVFLGGGIPASRWLFPLWLSPASDKSGFGGPFHPSDGDGAVLPGIPWPLCPIFPPPLRVYGYLRFQKVFLL